MSKRSSLCVHCGREFGLNPRVRRQRYCRDKQCQKARRARWQRHKMSTDLDYRDNQRRCQSQWQARHRGYYSRYRKNHPEYAQRNRLLQHMRDMRRRRNEETKMLAKMDSLIRPYYSRRGSIFKLIPQGTYMLAKMDSLTVRLVPI